MSGADREVRGGVAAETSGYPSAWESDVVLSDGGTLHVRPARPEDGDALVALHGRMSPQSIYFRYFSPRRTLPRAEVERFTNVDYVDRMSFVALLGDEMIGIAIYTRTGEREAEVAFAVEDAHQGRGLGTLLLEHLAAVARENGIDRFVAEVLPENRRMLRVFRDAGFEEKSRFGSGVVSVVLQISRTQRAQHLSHEREWRAEASSVRRLLAPGSIAVIGAGRRPGSVGYEVLRNLRSGGFRGPIFPIHPEAAEVQGLQAWPSVRDVPGAVDLAVLAVPSDRALDAVRDCAEKCVGSLVVISAGFAETGPEGARLERELVASARRNGMRVVGPNCLGIINTSPDVCMNATFAPGMPARSRVAFLSQSGALGIALLEYAGRRGLGLSSFASVGNKADVSGNDLLEYWESDPDTDVVLLYLESFGNPRKFARVARRVSRSKPVVAVKAGRSRAGTHAASSHTAALASDETAVEALFLQSGVIRVETFQEMLEVAQILVSQPLPEGRGVAVVGNSGGPGILAADACEAVGLDLPELSEATQADLLGFLPPGAAVRNPVDLIGSASGADYERALRRVIDDAAVDAVIAIYTRTPLTPLDDVARAIARVAENTEKPVVANFVGIDEAIPGLSRDAAEETVPTFAFPEPAARALARVAAYGGWRARPEGEVPAPVGLRRAEAHRVVRRALDRAPRGAWLAPDAAVALVRAYGIEAAPVWSVATADEAEREARARGDALVLKAASRDIVHRTDVGAVRTGLASPAAVRAAFEEMQAALGEAMGGALLQPEIAAGVETVVGVVHDASFGPLVMFGMGGVAVELSRDRAFRILPLTDRDARELVRAPRAAPLLFGYRGAPPCATDALEDLLLRVARLASDVPEIAEMDLNPVIVTPESVSAVDVKVRLEPWTPRPELGVRRLA